MNVTNGDNIKAWSSYTRDDAEKFGDDGDFARQHLLTPSVLELIGNVKEKTVMDAGCGTGYLSRKLAKAGALVTAVEPSDVLRYCIEREEIDNLGVVYIQEDLSHLDRFTGQFDAVIANMVLMDIPDYQAAMRNCVKALKQGGALVLSISHPCFEESGSEWVGKRYVPISEYFQEYEVQQRFGIRVHRTLSSYLNLIINLGCTITQVVEPRLGEQFANTDHDRNVHVPEFILLKATKGESNGPSKL